MCESREELVYMAKLAEQAERFEEVVVFMKRVAALKEELTGEERSLLSTAWKAMVDRLRESRRAMLSLKRNKENPADHHLAQSYHRKIEGELAEMCQDILNALSMHIIPFNKSSEARVFFYRMKGDYFRYLPEVLPGDDERNNAVSSSLEAYQFALEISALELSPTHPVYLSTALNCSVLYYENLNSPDEACLLAKATFEEAVAQLDTLDEKFSKSSLLFFIFSETTSCCGHLIALTRI